MLSDDDLLRIRGALREEIKTELQPVNRKLNRLKKDIAYVLNTHDEDIKDVRVRIGSLERRSLVSS